MIGLLTIGIFNSLQHAVVFLYPSGYICSIVLSSCATARARTHCHQCPRHHQKTVLIRYRPIIASPHILVTEFVARQAFKMGLSSTSLVAASLIVVSGFSAGKVSAQRTDARTFIDDLGVKHEFKGKPKIVAWSHLAVSLNHFGKCQKSLMKHANTPACLKIYILFF